MRKRPENLVVVHTHTHGVLLKNKKSNLIIKFKNIVLMAILLLLCIFSNSAEARGKVPEDLIQAKETAMNEIALGANDGITLTRTYSYNSGNPQIKLSWSEVEGASKYNVYQTKEGESEKLIATIQGTEVTINKANAEIKDDEPPTIPLVKATPNADSTGNNITITPSTDKGTTYRHRIIVKRKTEYLQKSYTTPGIYIWKCPVDITRVRVALCGGGSGATMGTNFTEIEEAGSGGTSRFGNLIKATGAIGLKIITIYSTSESGRVSEWKSEGNLPGEPNGNRGGATYNKNYANGGQGFALSFEKTPGKFGQGGRTRGYYNYDGPQDFSWAGNSGGYNTGYVDVVPGDSYEIVVGDGGEPCQLGKTSGYAEKGASGYVFIAFGGDIQPDIIYESNTVSTTVTSGIKGYQYAVTTSEKHTFTNEEIVSIDQIPTYISGEEQMVQYLHIRAIDNAGNTSATQTILLQVPAKITLKSDYQYGMNYVPLSWVNNDTRSGYVYRLYQKEEGVDSAFKQISTNNSIEQRVYKDEWSKPTTYTTPGTYTYTVPEGITRIKVAVVGGGGRRSDGI